MKKIVKLLSVAIVLASCSDDDSDEFVNPVVSDDLVGTWVLVSQIEDNTVVELNQCTAQSTLTFTNTMVTSQNVYLDEDTGECVEDDVSVINYTVSNNTITFTDVDDNSDSNEADISISGAETLSITGIGEGGVSIQTGYKREE